MRTSVVWNLYVLLRAGLVVEALPLQGKPWLSLPVAVACVTTVELLLSVWRLSCRMGRSEGCL